MRFIFLETPSPEGPMTTETPVPAGEIVASEPYVPDDGTRQAELLNEQISYQDRITGLITELREGSAITAEVPDAEPVPSPEAIAEQLRGIPGSEFLARSEEDLRTLFLEPETEAGYPVNFYGNREAYMAIGAGDLFPPTEDFEYIAINGVVGRREGFNGKKGYVDVNGNYMVIDTGDMIEPAPNPEEIEAYRSQAGQLSQLPTAAAEQAMSQQFLERTQHREQGAAEARAALAERLQAMGIEIRGLEGADFDNVDREALRAAFLEMSPREIWEFRSTIDNPPSTENFRQLMRDTGLDQARLTATEVESLARAELEQNPLFPGAGINTEQEVEILVALLHHESGGFNPFAVSHTGALGLGQMVSANYRDQWSFNPFDPALSVRYAAQHLRQDYPSFQGQSDAIEKTVVAYNRGGPTVSRNVARHADRWRMGLDAEGGAYFRHVMASHQNLYQNQTRASV